MNLLKEGLIYKNELLWKDTSQPYYLGFCYGTFSPDLSSSESIFHQEVSDRVLLSVDNNIICDWDEVNARDRVRINIDMVAPTDIRCNRMYIARGGRSKSRYAVKSIASNLVEVLEEEFPFALGERVLIKEKFFTIIHVNLESKVLTLDDSVTKATELVDASSTLLVGVVLPDVFLLKSGETINVSLQGQTVGA